MNRSEFARALRSAGEVAREHDFFVFGSQAILGLVARPPKPCLVSNELDIYPKHNSRAIQLIVAELGRRSKFFRHNGYFVDCVSPEIATLSNGWEKRLVPFRSKHTGGVTGWCLEIHDLAASKLAAGRDKDLTYVCALLQGDLVRPSILKRRIDQAPVSLDEKAEIHSRLEKVLH
jgi:hypothetical protein